MFFIKLNNSEKWRYSTEFLDETLSSEGNQQIEAHRDILAASSHILKHVLNQTKHPHPVIYMRGITLTCLEFQVLSVSNYSARLCVTLPSHTLMLISFIVMPFHICDIYGRSFTANGL